MITKALTPFLCKIVVQILNPAILLLSAAAFVYFIYGVAKFIIDKSRGEEATEGRSHMLWGIVGLAIIFGAYGIINIATGTFGLTPYNGPGCSTSSTQANPNSNIPYATSPFTP